MSANGAFGFFRLARFRLGFGVHLCERQFVFFPIKLFGHASVDEGEVYRINVRIENDMIEVPDDDCEGGEDGLVKMNGQPDVNPPTRQETEEANLEPDHQAGQTHDECAPDNGPILSLFGITETSNLRLRFFETEVIREIANHISHVLELRQHVHYPAAAVLRQGEIQQVIDTDDEHDYRRGAMQHAPQILIRTQQPGEPGIRVLQCKAAQHQHDEAGQQKPVLNALIGGETHDTARLASSRNHLLTPDEQVMHQHAADGQKNERQI